MLSNISIYMPPICIPPAFTLSVIPLLTPILIPSCIQFGSARIQLPFPALRGKNTCAPLQSKTCFTMASATSSGSMTSAPRFSISAITGAISGVRTQLGWIDVVRTLGALYERRSSWLSAIKPWCQLPSSYFNSDVTPLPCLIAGRLTFMETQNSSLGCRIVRHARNAYITRSTRHGHNMSFVLGDHIG